MTAASINIRPANRCTVFLCLSETRPGGDALAVSDVDKKRVECFMSGLRTSRRQLTLVLSGLRTFSS